ncbi:meiosis protein SPO22/ZIP4 like-domain-containing protein [Amylocystis lapponica]|nr:meiosis protein SPO22/ZIP4 like-domain-containing protein [Amylocystis lapponica]
MSARKRKLPSGLAQLFDAINDILVPIKPKLNETKPGALLAIRSDLHQIAVLAQSFSQQRPRSNKDWLHHADSLDREGVNLWNASALIREATDDDARAVFAALRLAGFRLIEAGLEHKLGIDTLIHVLGLASKAGAGLSEIGSNDLAASVLGSAAKYEEALRNAEDPQRLHAQAKARTTVLYYSSRMEAVGVGVATLVLKRPLIVCRQAWREGNDGVADFMLQKATENDQHLSLLLPRDRELLAAKLLAIGKSLLRTSSRDGNPATPHGGTRDSVKWMQKAFAIVEHLDDPECAGANELKRSILRSLARAYFLSSSEDPENLVRAEASLQELITSIDTAADPASLEYQQLRWMRIAVLKKRKATSPVLLDAFRSIIDHMRPTDNNITDILQELRTLGHDHMLVTAIHQHCLERVLQDAEKSNQVFVDRMLLSLIFHSSKDENHVGGIQTVAAAFTSLTTSGFELSRVSATACLTLLWQFGDRHFQGKRWGKAADWFLSGTHDIFGIIASISRSKCYRKAALCHIQDSEYAKASAVIRRCSGNEAATHYVVLLTAVHQGLEDEAISAVRAMVAAPDFNRKMLMLATRLANESDMKTLLLSVLEALLVSLRARDGPEIDAEAITLIRCIIRLVLKLMAEPASNRMVLIPALIDHFATATALVADLAARRSATMVAKDISWLWRTAYNCAIQGCSEWEDSEEKVAELFDIARQLLEAYCTSVLSDVDAEVQVHIINASFAAVAGKGVVALARRIRAQLIRSAVFWFRHKRASSEDDQTDEGLRSLSGDIASCKTRIQKIINSSKSLAEDEVTRAEACLHALRVFEAEVLCQLKEWEKLLHAVQDCVRVDALAVDTFEAVADILWAEKDCPVEVLFTALEAILHASLDRSVLSVEKFARWLRAICTILLSRNSAADRTKAIGYVEQAVEVLEGHSAGTGAEVYPLDERQWLLGTSYNTGIECLQFVILSLLVPWNGTPQLKRILVHLYWTRRSVGSRPPPPSVGFCPMARFVRKRYLRLTRTCSLAMPPTWEDLRLPRRPWLSVVDPCSACQLCRV